MKNYRITVNGNTYDVSVEEIGAATEVSAPVLPKQTAPKVSTAKQETNTAQSKAASGNGVKINAPMPGTVLDIKVSVGDKVKENSVVVILEAMKMENEIVTPVSGTVSSISVSKGATVTSGQLLITVEE